MVRRYNINDLNKIGLVIINMFLVVWLVIIVYLLVLLFWIMGIVFILNPVIRETLSIAGSGMGILSFLIGLFILALMFKLTSVLNNYMLKYLVWVKSKLRE